MLILTEEKFSNKDSFFGRKGVPIRGGGDYWHCTLYQREATVTVQYIAVLYHDAPVEILLIRLITCITIFLRKYINHSLLHLCDRGHPIPVSSLNRPNIH